MFRHTILAALAGLIMTVTVHAQEEERARPDRTETIVLAGGQTIEVDYHLPDDFDPQTPYPVLISVGDFFLRDDPAEFDWVIVRAGIVQRGFSATQTTGVLDHIAGQMTVAGGRFHILGYSASSGPVFRVAASLPDRFTGIVALPGHPGNDAHYDAVSQMKIRFIVGENDGYWLREARAAHRRFERMGTDTEIEIIEDGGHVLEQLAGRPLFERFEAWFGDAARGGEH